jgi:hypothetical protein
MNRQLRKKQFQEVQQPGLLFFYNPELGYGELSRVVEGKNFNSI